MEINFDFLSTVRLFAGIEQDKLAEMLACLEAELRLARKGEIILLAGDTPTQVGIVLAGQLYIMKEDYEGNRSLVAALGPGEIFAEALCCAGITESPVTVIAEQNSRLMLLSFSRLLHTCPNSCPFHQRVIENMLRLIAGKNLLLQERMDIVGLKSVRQKVLRYLESQLPRQGRHLTIPFNREELADFLCVERSALSHELSRMKKDGLIDYHKNSFILK